MPANAGAIGPPTVAAYLSEVVPPERRSDVWRWLASLPRAQRREARVIDLVFAATPHVDVDAWEPIAEHPRWLIWLVKPARRRPASR